MDNSFSFTFDDSDSVKPLIKEKEVIKTEIKKEDKTLYIVDAYAIIYRSYYAFINNKMLDENNNNISCVHGFFNTLAMLFNNYKIDYLAIAFDTRGPTFRHQRYKEYKANRESAPEDLHPQVPIIKSILEKSNIRYIEQDDVEADDIIAALTNKSKKENIVSVIVTGDKDLLQLVGDKSFALRPPKPKTNDWRLFGITEVKQEFNVDPSQILDYLALIGDTSDNIPGVKGLGPKTAVKLLDSYKDLDQIYSHVNSFAKGVTQKLISDKENAYLSYNLVMLRPDLVKDELDFNTMNKFDLEKVSQELSNLKLNSASFNIKKSLKEEVVITKQKVFNNSVGKYEKIEDKEKLEFLLNQCKKNNIFCFNLLTLNKEFNNTKVIGYSFCYQSKRSYYVSLDDNFKIDDIKDILEDSSVKKISHDIKFYYKVLKYNFNIEINNIYFDTQIASYDLDSSSKRYGLDFLSKYYLDYDKNEFNLEKNQSLLDLDINTIVNIVCEECDLTTRLYQEFIKEIEAKDLNDVFFNLDMPLLKILGDMEIQGVYLDLDYNKKLLEKFDEKRTEIENKIYKLSNIEFNINSPQQLAKVLFEDMGLKPKKKTSTKQYSTSDDVLESIDHPIATLIQEYRENNKLINTYVLPLAKMVDKNSRIHTHYNIYGTETGRLSSNDPNLQNIPIRTENGRLVRSMFKASDDKVLLSSDYSQIELVVLSHLSKDENLQKAFKNNDDVHSYTASLIFDKDVSEITKEQRAIAKTINFGVLYGMSSFRLARDLKITREESQEFINSYFDRYSLVKSFITKVTEDARINGFVTTMFKRKREIKDINSKNTNIKNASERMAVNTVVQGTASDIIKKAMINIVNKLEKNNLKSKLILQVHDELIFEVDKKELDIVKKLVKDEMINVVKLDIPLKVGVEESSRWGDMH